MKKTMFALSGLVVLIGLLISFQIFRAKKNIGPIESQTMQIPLTEKEKLESDLSDLKLKLEQIKGTLQDARFKLCNMEEQKTRAKLTPKGLAALNAEIQKTRKQKTNLEKTAAHLKITIKALETKLKELKEKEEQALEEAIPFIED